MPTYFWRLPIDSHLTKEHIAAGLTYAGTICESCNKPNHQFMVTDKLWKKVSRINPHTGQMEQYLCLICVEKRLKRGLIEADFNGAPINYEIFGFDCVLWERLTRREQAQKPKEKMWLRN